MKDLLFSFNGRITRREFWVGFAIYLLVNVTGVLAIDAWLSSWIWTSLFSLSCLYLLFAISAKRYHDLDMSGWWSLIWLAPLVGWIYGIIECGFRKGDVLRNRFGNPLCGPLTSESRSYIRRSDELPVPQRPKARFLPHSRAEWLVLGIVVAVVGLPVAAKMLVPEAFGEDNENFFIKLGMIWALAYFLYGGANWARWVTVAVYSVATVVALVIGGYSLFQGAAELAVYTLATAAISCGIVLTLSFEPSVNRFFESA